MSPRAEQVKADARLGAPCPSSSLSGRRLADPLWHQSSVIMYQNRRQRDGRGASSSPLDTRYFCKASVSTRREKKNLSNTWQYHLEFVQRSMLIPPDTFRG